MGRRPQKITFAEMRSQGEEYRLIIFCGGVKCSHNTVVADDPERWPGHVRLSDIEPKFVCTACGHRGAIVRPQPPPPRMGTDGSR